MPKKEKVTIWIYTEPSRSISRVCVNHKEVDRGGHSYCSELAEIIGRSLNIVGIEFTIQRKEV